MHLHCMGYQEDGTICRAPATIVDRQRSGMVCEEHKLIPPILTAPPKGSMQEVRDKQERL